MFGLHCRSRIKQVDRSSGNSSAIVPCDKAGISSNIHDREYGSMLEELTEGRRGIKLGFPSLMFSLP